jgi:hypothetical protein
MGDRVNEEPTPKAHRLSPGSHLRLVWPQWQGAGSESVRALAPEFPFAVARRGYTVGTTVLRATPSTLRRSNWGWVSTVAA